MMSSSSCELKKWLKFHEHMRDTRLILADMLNVPPRKQHVEGAEGLELGSAEGVRNE